MTDEVNVSFGADISALQAKMTQLQAEFAEVGVTITEAGQKAIISNEAAAASFKTNNAAARQLVETQRALAAQASSVSGEMDALMASLNPAHASTLRLSEGTQTLDKALKLGVITAEDHASALAQLTAKYGTVEKAAHGAAHGSSAVTREMMVMSHEVMQGRFSRIPGSFMVMAQYAGGFGEVLKTVGKAMLGPIGAVVALVSASIALAAAFENAKGKEERFNNALASTGDYSGKTLDQIRALSSGISDSSNLSSSAAEDMATSLMASGKIGSDAFDSVARAAASYAAATGDSAAQSASWAEKIFIDPVKGAKELAATMHNINDLDMAHIETLDRMGKSSEAAAFLADKYTKSMNGVTKSLHWWSIVARDASNVWDAFTKSIAPDSLSEQARKLSGDIAQLIDQQRRMGGAGNNHTLDSELKQKQKELIALNAEITKAGEAVAAKKKTSDANDASLKAHEIAAKANTTLAQEQKLISDIAVLKTNLAKVSLINSKDARAETDLEIEAIKKKEIELEKLEHPKAKHAAQKSQMGKMEESLRSQQALMIEQQGRAMSLTEEAKYWTDISVMAKLSATDRVSVEKKIVEATLAIDKKGLSDKKVLDAEALQSSYAAGLHALSLKKIAIDQDLSMHKISVPQHVALEKQLASDELAETTKYYAAKDKLEAADVAKHMADILALQKAHEKYDLAITKADKEAATYSAQFWADASSGIQSSFTSTFTKILHNQLSFKHSMQALGQDIADSLISSFAKISAQWVMDQATMTYASKAGAVERMAIESWAAIKSVAMSAWAAITKIMHNAWVSASAAFSSQAIIPYVGPALGVAAAIAAVALVGGFASNIGGFEQGTNFVPKDGLAYLHAGEKIIPKGAEGPAYKNMATDSGSGAQNFHVTIHAMDAASVKQLFMDHGSSLADALQKQIRNFKPMKA
jgi:phage-related minor tail protein